MASSRNTLPDGIGSVVAGVLRAHGVTTLRIGLSGGIDSTVLAHVLSSLRDAHSLSLDAVHVHHGLSPHADRWAQACAEFCASLEIPLAVRSITISQTSGEGVEGEARRLRRQALLEDARGWIALGHHRDDQAETILANLLRGTGVLGAAAMPPAAFPWLRPLLDSSREQIEGYANHHSLTWCEDESNGDTRYTRNYLRHRVMPLLEDCRQGSSKRLAQAAERFADAQRLLDELAELDLDGASARFPVASDLLKRLSANRATNLLRYLLAGNKLQSPDATSLAEFIRQLHTAGPDRHPRLRIGPASIELRRHQLHLIYPD